MAEAMVKGWVTEPPLHRDPSQQKPWTSMSVQGLVVPMTVQEGRWQVRMYTGTEKLSAGGVGRGGGTGQGGGVSTEGSQGRKRVHTHSQCPSSDQGHASLLRSARAFSIPGTAALP